MRRFLKLLVRAALVLTGVGILGFVGYKIFDIAVLTPSKRVFEMNRGERVWDPYAEILTGPVRSDEGFVCPGGMLYGDGGDPRITRTRKVKVIEKIGENKLGVKLFNAPGETPGSQDREYSMYTKDFRKSLPCPARQP